MPNNDIEVFEYLLSDGETALEIDYLTYAMFAYKKKQWIDHFKSRNDDRHPTQQEIDGWISELTPYDFGQMRTEAADFFHYAAEEHLADYIERQKEDAVNNSVLTEVQKSTSDVQNITQRATTEIQNLVQQATTEVRNFTSPLRHLGIALLMAVIAPVILGGIVFLVSLFDRTFPIHLYVAPPSSQSAPPK